MKPGDLGMYDAAYVARHAPWLRDVLHRWFRARVEGMERLPAQPFLAVGNHNGGVMMPDTLVWMAAYHTSNRPIPLLALTHDALFASYPAPLSTALAKLGAVRADPEVALAALRAGCAVQAYPGGDRDACKPWRRRHEIVFAGHVGYARVALRAQVPVVPVVSIGAHEALVVLADGARVAERLGLRRRRRLAALPLSWSLPWGFWIGPQPGYLPLPTKIVVRVLEPIVASGDPDDARDVAALDRRVREALQRALDALARERRWPIVG